jgi:pyruvate dehydrogenase E2 component (dihydrolipoamide acetyltransferase)
MAAVPMPRLSDAMDRAVVLRWLKEPGDDVAVGDDLVEIETDKATVVYQAEQAGRLSRPVPEGTAVGLGEPIAWIGDDAPAPEPEPPAAAPQTPPPSPAAAEPSPRVAPPATAARPRASPAARAAARRLGVDLAAVAGTGPGSRIVLRDVAAAPSAPAPQTAGSRVPLSRIQLMIARRMTEAKQVPEFVVERDADVGLLMAARERLRARGGDVPSFNDLVIAAAARALRAHPQANASLDGDDLVLHDQVNVGFAVAAAGTLLVPVVADADRKGVAAIAGETRALAQAAREGTIAPDALAGGTFTVSNLGMFGVDAFTAILNPPQVAILAVARIRREPALVDGAVVEAQRVRLRLTCDHRVLYGADGAAFLATIATLLEEPLALAL